MNLLIHLSILYEEWKDEKQDLNHKKTFISFMFFILHFSLSNIVFLDWNDNWLAFLLFIMDKIHIRRKEEREHEELLLW